MNLTICPRCGRAKLPQPRTGPEWQKPPACFRPKPGVTITNEECPDCLRARGMEVRCE